MKTLVVFALACLTSSQAASTPKPTATTPTTTTTPLHFTFVCTSKTSATITVDAGYKVGSSGPCSPKNTTAIDYTLDDKCVPAGMFVFEKSKDTYRQQKNVYTLNCTDQTNGVLQTVAASLQQVKDVSASPNRESGLVSHSPPPQMQMILSTTEKTSLAFSDISNAPLVVSLGTTFKLFIIPRLMKTEPTFIIPQQCEASSGPNKLTLWKLHGASNQCVREDAVMKTIFINKKTSDNVRYAVSEIEAFQFEQDIKGNLNFTCSIRVCTSIPSGSTCDEDNTALACTPKTPPPAVGRRRRDVKGELEDGPPGKGRLHYVAATLRIRDDIMATGISSGVHYTMTCLVLPVLAMVVM